MYVYIIILVLVLAGAFLPRQGSTKSTVYLVCWLATLALFVGFSDMLGGYDRYIYGELFDNLADQLRIGIPTTSSRLFIAYHSEFGYVGLNWLIAHITNNRYIFINFINIYYCWCSKS